MISILFILIQSTEYVETLILVTYKYIVLKHIRNSMVRIATGVAGLDSATPA